MTTCTTPIGHERLVAYWANDLAADDLDALETHLFGCSACTKESERIARLAQALRTMPPPVIEASQLESLRAAGLVVVENRFEPDVRRVAVFERDVDVLIHRLAGLELSDAERVEVVIRSESRGPLLEDPFAPFDRSRGEVLIACQRHFEVMPHDIAIDVRVFRRATAPITAIYLVPHEYRT